MLNNHSTIHAGSTKSYDYVREHNEAVNRLDFWPNREAINIDYAEGGVLNTVEKAFNQMDTKELCPGSGVLEKVNAALR